MIGRKVCERVIVKGYTEFDLFAIDREEEYRYVDVEGGVKVVGYTGEKEYIEIPEVLHGKPVIAIGFSGEVYPKGKEVTLLVPNTVTYIDPRANTLFYGGWYKELFLKKENEHFLAQDNFLYSKDKKTLYFCFNRKIKHLVISEEVEHIGDYAFSGQHFESISLPSHLKSIGSHAFKKVNTTIEVPESIEKIGDYIAKHYTLVGNNKCYKLVDGCVYSIDGKTLVQCVDSNRSQITIPDHVETIRPYAFSGIKITKLDLGTGVKEIGEKAFDDAEIKTIRIPNQLVHLSDTAFCYMKCNSVRVGKENKHFYSDGICFFSVNEKEEKRLLVCFKNKEEEYDVPEGVTTIAPGAFYDCADMKRISLPKSLQAFDEGCLSKHRYSGTSCAVKKIEIPEYVSKLNINCIPSKGTMKIIEIV